MRALPARQLDTETLPMTWLAARLGVPPERLAAMRRAGELIAIGGGPGGEYIVPLWQLDDEGHPLEIVKELLAAARAAAVRPERLHELLRVRAGLGGPRLYELLHSEPAYVLAAVREAIRAEASTTKGSSTRSA